MGRVTCAWAAKGGHLEVLQDARGARARHVRDAARAATRDAEGARELPVGRGDAAFFGHLEVLKWARERLPMGRVDAGGEGRPPRGAVWTPRTGCPCGTADCANAARGGHLEVLQWARENGCPWDDETYAWAARGGHLDILNRARESGCP